jgi:D-alanyl-D-alanine carboxypeptidase
MELLELLQQDPYTYRPVDKQNALRNGYEPGDLGPLAAGTYRLDREAFVEDYWRWLFGEAGVPERLAWKVADSSLESAAFVMELLELLQQDSYSYYLVDKQHSLPGGYEPDDLVPLTAGVYRVGREGLMLRRMAADALREMAAAAAAEGIGLTIGSTYRSAEYQAQVYEREVRIYGREIADRQSAQPGKSQHQLGLVVDFAPIDDIFAKTPVSEWLLRNAARFGWSLSYPDGYEQVTGYRWESWHYRYVGRDLAAFINNYFDGIQQYALQFIQVWQEQATE